MSRPAYSAINMHATRGRPALLFVPTRKHARLVALDMLTFAASDVDPHKFRCEASQRAPTWAFFQPGACGGGCGSTQVEV
eukprot:211478-Chlamydomonas_euryale.AAC.1